MDKAIKKKIEKILGSMHCPKNFKCYASGFRSVCRARGINGLDKYLECLEENPQDCRFSSTMGGDVIYYCTCPLRLYIAKKILDERL